MPHQTAAGPGARGAACRGRIAQSLTIKIASKRKSFRNVKARRRAAVSKSAAQARDLGSLSVSELCSDTALSPACDGFFRTSVLRAFGGCLGTERR